MDAPKGPLAGDAATAADVIRELVRRSGSPGLEAAVEGVPDEQVEQTVAWSLDGVDREALLRAGAEEVLRGRAPELLRAVRTAVDEWEVAMLCSTASELYLDACLESLDMAGQCLGNAGAVVLAGALSDVADVVLIDTPSGTTWSASEAAMRWRLTTANCSSGVFFRKHTTAKATELGLGGWVMNAKDGSVVGEIQGHAAPVESMRAWLRTTGSPRCSISGAKFTTIAPDKAHAYGGKFETRR
ncbi:hypothetical protein FNF27_07226 [Cafeteria roenbergensis]|uniref:acylphosphatase n=1 Tax=Cafeteria roenbergensis TaxID=33653 RepID=A0A5A8DS17_CAFRO|nr:hypothetical protein FNF27_07226 [Cafeteria roenbergensis]